MNVTLNHNGGGQDVVTIRADCIPAWKLKLIECVLDMPSTCPNAEYAWERAQIFLDTYLSLDVDPTCVVTIGSAVGLNAEEIMELKALMYEDD